MSWSYEKAGRASKMAEIVEKGFQECGGCPAGLAEETVKNALGGVAATLCRGLKDDKIVHIDAHGSAWNDGEKAHSQRVSFKFETLGDFVE